MSRAAEEGQPLRALTPLAFRASLVAYAVLRLAMLAIPQYVHDLDAYRAWSLGSALWGLPAAYEHTGINYPPVYLYIVHPVGEFYLWLHPELREARIHRAKTGELFFQTADGRIYRSWDVRFGLPRTKVPVASLPDSQLLSFMVRAPLLLCDFATAAMLYWLVARAGFWGVRPDPRRWARLAALLYLYNPAVLWCSGYWAQVDAIHSMLVVASFAFLAFDRMAGAGMLLCAAVLMKPLPAVLVPVLVVAAALRGGPRGLWRAGLGGLAVACLVFLPFFATGRGVDTLRAVLMGVDLMPYTSVNGHNLWWLIGGWREANVPVLGPLTAKQLGMLMLACGTLALLWRSRGWLAARDRDPDAYRIRLFLLAATISALCFSVSTHMHENHLFMTIPLLIAVAGRRRSFAWLAGLVSAVSVFNIALHDSGLLIVTTPLLAHESPLQWAASYANSLLVLGITAGCCIATWREATPHGGVSDALVQSAGGSAR